MKKPRRPRADSTESLVKAAQNAVAPMLVPPDRVTLHGEAWKFWPGIILSRARDEWRDVDLVVAAQLANCQADIESETATIKTEGTVVINARGTQVMNPRHSVLEALARREMALMRALQMVGRLTGPVDDKVKARRAEADARAMAKHVQGESTDAEADEDVLA